MAKTVSKYSGLWAAGELADLIAYPIPEGTNFLVILVAYAIDQIVTPFDVKLGPGIKRYQTACIEICGDQYASSQRDAFPTNSSFNRHASVTVARASHLRVGQLHHREPSFPGRSHANLMDQLALREIIRQNQPSHAVAVLRRADGGGGSCSAMALIRERQSRVA